MARLLSDLVAEYARANFGDNDPGALFEAQKELEKRIVSEICEERAHEISERKREIELVEEIKTGRREIAVAVVECVVLAIPVGLVGSHLYDLLRVDFYGVQADFSILSLRIGLLICFLACVVILVVLLLNQLAKAAGLLAEMRSKRD